MLLDVLWGISLLCVSWVEFEEKTVSDRVSDDMSIWDLFILAEQADRRVHMFGHRKLRVYDCRHFFSNLGVWHQQICKLEA